MLFSDNLTYSNPRRTADGFLAVRARAARAGIYDYLGREVDPEGKHFAADAVVKVYRPEEEVFAKDSVASFLMKPVTNDHPAKPVTAANWRDYAKGVIGKAMRDGDFLAFDIVLMDKDTIDAVESGKRELSNGYASQIEIGDGVTADGQEYHAVQTAIRGNHIAIVDKGRAGPFCRIGDCASCEPVPSAEIDAMIRDERTYSAPSDDGTKAHQRRETVDKGNSHMATKTIIVDGLQVEVTDAAEAAINKLQGQVTVLTADKAAAEGKVDTLTAEKVTLDAKVAELEQAVKDAKPTAAQLRDAAKAYAATADKAKALGVTVSDEMDEPAIIKAVVTAKLGDKAEGWSDAQFAAAFATMDAKADPVRAAISSGQPVIANDASAIRDRALAERNGHLTRTN